MRPALILFAFIMTFSCTQEKETKLVKSKAENVKNKFGEYKANSKKKVFSAVLNELSNYEYKDNPDIGYWVNHYHSFKHDTITFSRKDNGNFSIAIGKESGEVDSIFFKDVDLKVYMPSIPKWLRNDEFMSVLGYTNSEWNRQQIRYMRSDGYFSIHGDGFENKNVKRIDIARNCLRTGLWEVSIYAEEEGKVKPSYHGWFFFPSDLFAELFEEVNEVPVEKYIHCMANWVDPKNDMVKVDMLRKVDETISIKYENLNHQYYPLTGARKSKFKNIIYPHNPKKIQDFLSDSTVYSTFTPPGIYSTADPRKTELSKLAVLDTIHLRRVSQPSKPSTDTLSELELVFYNPDKTEKTHVYFGGIDLSKVPELALIDNNKGYKMPFGFGNHAFYETYQKAMENPVISSTYYGVIVDDNMRFLDSHSIGVDGPILFWDKEKEGVLHIMILSFERHSFVGHFTLQII